MKYRLLAILIFVVQIGFGQIYIDSYRFAQPAANLLLDDYPGAAAAYSLRKLDKDYTGAAIRIRTAGGSETDIGFDGSGNLNTSAINVFCAGTTCTVATWYDQSGNGNDATQATAANQPTIYTGGAVVSEGGKPAIDFDGSNDFFDLSSPISTSLPNTSFFVSKRKASNAVQWGFVNKTKTAPYSPVIYNTNVLVFYGSSTFYSENTSFNNNNRNLITGIDPYTTFPIIYVNGSVISNVNGRPPVFGTSYETIGYRKLSTSAAELSNAKKQELIYYPSDQSANRENIENNINSYYAIY